MKVPQLEPWLGKEEYEAVKSCITSTWITEGPLSEKFVNRLLKLIGSKYGVLAPNGTLAIYLGLRALGVGEGDEVIIPDFTFIASATAVEMTGAVPIFVDVNNKNFQIDLSNADRIVNKRTKAIMPVHIYGTVADMDGIMKFAQKHNLKVIEDAAEAIGVHRKGKHAGAFGDVGCFSFFADKTITTAEGGLVVTDDKKIYEQLLYLRNQGRLDRGSFIHPRVGYNFRMTDIQSAIGLVQLDKLEEIKKRKLENLNKYKKLLGDCKEITFFEPDEDAEMIPFRVGILYRYAHELMEYLRDNQIQPRSYFYPLHKQPAFDYLQKKLKFKDSDFANSIYGFECGVCLPVFPTLTDRQIEYVCQKIKDFINLKKGIFYKYYDVLYQDKDYKGEIELIYKIVEKYSSNKILEVLEIGCGTGNHTKELAKKAKKVVAIDIDPQMSEIARSKMKRLKINNAKILNISVDAVEEKAFDLAVALFNVVTYFEDFSSLQKFLSEVSKRLKSGGLFIFDVWSGIAAIKDPPRVVKKTFRKNKERIETVLIPKTDFLKQRTLMDYRIKVFNGKRLKEEGSIKFNQTLWTPNEIISAANKAKLDIVKASPLMDISRDANENDWKIMFVFQKR